MSNPLHSIPITLDNDCFYLDLILRDLESSEELIYHLESRQNQFYSLQNRARQYIALCIIILHNHLSVDPDSLPKIIEGLVKDMKNLGILKNQSYNDTVSQIMMMDPSKVENNDTH